MSGVRVLVGTKKGAFVLTADGKRNKWEISGPHFAGWEIYHVKGSPADPNRVFASQTSGWFGQVIQRSNDGGKTFTSPRAFQVVTSVTWTDQGKTLWLASDEGLLDAGLKIRTMVLPDVFLDHDSPNSQYETAGLTARHIVATALAALGRDIAMRPARA